MFGSISNKQKHNYLNSGEKVLGIACHDLGVKNVEKVNVNCEGTGEKKRRGGQGGSI